MGLHASSLMSLSSSVWIVWGIVRCGSECCEFECRFGLVVRCGLVGEGVVVDVVVLVDRRIVVVAQVGVVCRMNELDFPSAWEW